MLRSTEVDLHIKPDHVILLFWNSYLNHWYISHRNESRQRLGYVHLCVCSCMSVFSTLISQEVSANLLNLHHKTKLDVESHSACTYRTLVYVGFTSMYDVNRVFNKLWLQETCRLPNLFPTGVKYCVQISYICYYHYSNVTHV